MNTTTCPACDGTGYGSVLSDCGLCWGDKWVSVAVADDWNGKRPEKVPAPRCGMAWTWLRWFPRLICRTVHRNAGHWDPRDYHGRTCSACGRHWNRTSK